MSQCLSVQNPNKDITRRVGQDPIDQQSKRTMRKYVKNIARIIAVIANKPSAQKVRVSEQGTADSHSGDVVMVLNISRVLVDRIMTPQE